MAAAKAGPLECKARLEGVLTRATAQLKDLLAAQQARLRHEYEAIRAAHFPCVARGRQAGTRARAASAYRPALARGP